MTRLQFGHVVSDYMQAGRRCPSHDNPCPIGQSHSSKRRSRRFVPPPACRRAPHRRSVTGTSSRTADIGQHCTHPRITAMTAMSSAPGHAHDSSRACQTSRRASKRKIQQLDWNHTHQDQSNDMDRPRSPAWPGPLRTVGQPARRSPADDRQTPSRCLPSPPAAPLHSLTPDQKMTR